MYADQDRLSLDPRTWVLDPVAPRATAPRAAIASLGHEGAGSTSPMAPDRRRSLLAAASSAAILLAGAGLSRAMREPAPAAAPAAAAPVAVVAAPATPVENANRRTLVIAGAGDLGPTLASSGVAPAEVAAALKAAAALGTAPGEVRLEFDLAGDGPAQRLTRLEATRQDGAGVTLTAQADGTYAARTLDAKLTTRVKVVRGEMDATSFYNAAVTAGITDSLISDFAGAFSFDFDFQREIKPGDVFEAAFEQKVNPAGVDVGAPSLIYVSMSTPDKSKALYHFLAPGETEPGWYDGNGRSTVRALMRTPVDGARISSSFGMRMHPVLGFMKLHEGIDFAVPVGTPIYASGDATVEWAAMKGPNGNLTVLRHANGWQTFYLHQSMFMPGVVPGAHVRQGQQIGAVGLTGRTTGPHLHYGVKIDGQWVDPAGIDTGTGKALAGPALTAFTKERDRIDAVRAKAL